MKKRIFNHKDAWLYLFRHDKFTNRNTIDFENNRSDQTFLDHHLSRASLGRTKKAPREWQSTEAAVRSGYNGAGGPYDTVLYIIVFYVQFMLYIDAHV